VGSGEIPLLVVLCGRVRYVKMPGKPVRSQELVF
jgi:hypothetical protein